MEPKLLLQRNALHFGFDARYWETKRTCWDLVIIYNFHFEHRCSVLYLNPRTNRQEILTLNPLTGDVTGPPTVMADKFVQAVQLHHTTEDHLRPLLLVEESSVAFYPASAASDKVLLDSIKDKTFIVTLDKAQGIMTGQKLIVR